MTRLRRAADVFAISGTCVESDVGSAGAREKDFVSLAACLGDMEGAMELRHLR